MVFGPQLRVIFPAVVSTEDSAFWIYFIVDTGSPLTYLSTQVNTLPLVIVSDSNLTLGCKVAGHSKRRQRGCNCRLLPAGTPLSNIFPFFRYGSDFLMSKSVNLSPNFRRKFVTLYFRSETKWNAPTKR